MMPLKKNKAWTFNDKILPSCSITGLFTGLSVEILDNAEIKALNESGSWGEGSLSRSVPGLIKRLDSEELPSITAHQYQRRLEWKQKYLAQSTGDLVKVIYKSSIVQRDTVLEDEISKVLENPFMVNETLVLFLEEAFFLSYFVKCLTVRSLVGNIIVNDQLWIAFCKLKHNFVECFVAYLYLKTKNWIIKPGIKFGGHFLLYKQSPRIYHASYIVVVTSAAQTSNNFLMMQRIAETTSKEILYIDVIYPTGLDKTSNEAVFLPILDQFTITETKSSRFLVRQEQLN